MHFDPKDRSNQDLLNIYSHLVLPRLIEEKMLILLRQGKISKWFSGIGQEAISVGAALAAMEDEYILPMHRNLGVFTTRGVSLVQLFAQFQGKQEGFTKGRDRSFHFGSLTHRLVGMISHLGAQLGVADGLALSHLLNEEQKVCFVFTGDGGTSEGDFHEAVNVASVWNLPVVFIIENNGYGLSTPSREQFNFESFTVKGPAYGIEAYSVEGNDILEVLNELEPLAESIRNRPRPVIFEARTFRMRGHEEASGTKYVPEELMKYWSQKDPIERYENFLKSLVDEASILDIRNQLKDQISEAVDEAFALPAVSSTNRDEINDVLIPVPDTKETDTTETTSMRFVDAIQDGLRAALRQHDSLIFMGQDIAEYGGVFKISEGFVEEFGKQRIRNTPICESAIVGTALGLSLAGHKAMVEMQFADFVSCGFNQIVNNLAKIHYRWEATADVVIRMPTGAGVGAGPFHSQSTEAWFFHVPGLKIVYPSHPADAKQLLLASVADPNPVLFFEHKALYRSLEGEVPVSNDPIRLGPAIKRREGTSLTVVTYGLGVHWALEAIEELAIDAELIDLVTLLPWDQKLVYESVRKTNKAIVLHEDVLTGGIGAEIASSIMSACFEDLDAPVIRVGALDTPVPFAKPLEDNFLPKIRLKEELTALLNY